MRRQLRAATPQWRKRTTELIACNKSYSQYGCNKQECDAYHSKYDHHDYRINARGCGAETGIKQPYVCNSCSNTEHNHECGYELVPRPHTLYLHLFHVQLNSPYSFPELIELYLHPVAQRANILHSFLNLLLECLALPCHVLLVLLQIRNNRLGDFLPYFLRNFS